MSRRSALSVLGLGAVSLLASCDLSLQGQGDGQVEVSGEFGTTPQVEFRPPLRVSAPYTEEILTGSGTELRDGSALMLSYLAIDAITGKTLSENFQNPPEIMMLGEETGVLYPELLGRVEGSRILRVETGTRDRPNPTVLTYDIRHTSAWGEPVEPLDEDDENLPLVEVDEEGVPRVEVPDADPPSDLQIIPVRRGDGPQVRPGHAITVRYSTLSWGSGEVTDTLWGEGTVPTTIPFTGLIPAWQDGLVDEQAGSRVMLITPPDQAFGTETLVFLIDVLAVSVQEGEDVDALLDDDEGRPGKDGGEGPPEDEDPPEEDPEEGEDG